MQTYLVTTVIVLLDHMSVSSEAPSWDAVGPDNYGIIALALALSPFVTVFTLLPLFNLLPASI